MKAVILAAGKGTRMGDLTANLPKPMLQVDGRPILEHIVEGLRDEAKIHDLFIIIGWQGHVIRDHFGDGRRWNVRITYGEQKVQDGTGKAPEVARDWVGTEPFLLASGDILLRPPTDYALLVEAFREDGVIALKAGGDLTKGGAVVLNDEGFMTSIVEKGSSSQIPVNAYYNAAIYVLPPRIFDYTTRLQKSPRGEYELTDALRAFVQAGARLRGVILRQEWADVRDPSVLAELNSRAKNKKKEKNMNTTTTQPVSLKVSRLIKAPRERVFAAWITPADIMRWLGGEKCQIEKATIDSRVGGEYHFKMKGNDAGKPGMTGVFREIKSPERLVFTWLTGGCTGEMPRVETLVTVEFTAQAGGTLVQITHEGFPDAELRDGHNDGWTASLEKLEKLV